MIEFWSYALDPDADWADTTSGDDQGRRHQAGAEDVPKAGQDRAAWAGAARVHGRRILCPV